MKSNAPQKPLVFTVLALLIGLLSQGLVMVSAPSVVEAGVLVKRVSIKGASTPKARITRAKESTNAARRTNPSFKIKGDTEKQIAKIQKQRVRYLKQLHRWEQRKARAEQRARQKQQQELQVLAKTQQRERTRLMKKKAGFGFGSGSSGVSEPAASPPRSTVTVGKRSETGKPSLFDRGKDSSSKRGILSHFWKALFG